MKQRDYAQLMADSVRDLLFRRPDLHITVDGYPGTITGFCNRFATVSSLDGKLSGQWAWDAVAKVLLEKEGAFQL